MRDSQFLDTMTSCAHRMMQSGIIQSQRPRSLTRAGSLRSPPGPLTLTRQQRLMRHLIILKWLFPAGGAPCSIFFFFYDQMSWAFTGQVLHQLHSEVTLCASLFWVFFFSSSEFYFGRNVCANDVNVNLFTQRFMVFNGAKYALYYSSVMQTIAHLINQTPLPVIKNNWVGNWQNMCTAYMGLRSNNTSLASLVTLPLVLLSAEDLAGLQEWEVVFFFCFFFLGVYHDTFNDGNANTHIQKYL